MAYSRTGLKESTLYQNSQSDSGYSGSETEASFSQAYTPGLAFVSSTMWNQVTDVAPSGNHLFATYANGLVVVDITDRTHPLIVSRMFLDSSAAVALAVDNGYAYIAQRETFFGRIEPALIIVDISNPSEPVRIGSYQGFCGPVDVAICDHKAFLACSSGLQVVDVSNPTAPELVGEYTGFPSDSGYTPHGLAVRSDTVFVAAGDIWIFDASAPGAPRPLKRFKTLHNAIQVAVQDSFLYVADLSDMRPSVRSSLSIVRWNPIDSIRLVSATDRFGDVNSVSIQNSLACIGAGLDGVQLYNVSDPALPTLVGCYNSPSEVIGVSLADSSLFVIEQRWPGQDAWGFDSCSTGALPLVPDSGNIQILDVINPDIPVLAGLVPVPGYVSYLALGQGVVYAADEYGGLGVVRTYDGGAMEFLSSQKTPYMVSDVAMEGSQLYVASLDSGFYMYDVTTPESPVVVGHLAVTSPVLGLDAHGFLALVASMSSGLVSVDVSNAASPQLLNTYWPASAIHDPPVDVVVEGQRAFVSWVRDGLYLFDITDPSNLRLVSKYPTDGSEELVRGVAVHESLVAAAGFYCLLLFDFTDESQPTLLSRVPLSDDPQIVRFLRKDLVAVTMAITGIVFFDVSDPRLPVDIGRYRAWTWTADLESDSSYLYLATTSALFKLSLPTLTSVPDAPDGVGRREGLPTMTCSPNPFNSTVSINLELPSRGRVLLRIYDILGRHVATLVDGSLSVGQHTLHWNANDSSGRPLSSGVYLVDFCVREYRVLSKVVLVK